MFLWLFPFAIKRDELSMWSNVKMPRVSRGFNVLNSRLSFRGWIPQINFFITSWHHPARKNVRHILDARSGRDFKATFKQNFISHSLKFNRISTEYKEVKFSRFHRQKSFDLFWFNFRRILGRLTKETFINHNLPVKWFVAKIVRFFFLGIKLLAIQILILYLP